MITACYSQLCWCRYPWHTYCHTKVKKQREVRNEAVAIYINIGSSIIVAFAFAAEKPSLEDTKPEGVKAAKAKAASSKEIKLNATGKVMEVSETNMKIERNVKGKDGAPVIMEFVLEKPKKVEIGDKVNVTYIKKEGQNVALRVAKVTAIKKSITKAEKPTDAKQAPAGPAPR